MLTTFVTYCAVGAIAGILAGLLGIGGGLVIVPMLVYVFALNHIPHELTMHLALATSMASIMFTSVSSFMAHHKRGAVRWDVVQKDRYRHFDRDISRVLFCLGDVDQFSQGVFCYLSLFCGNPAPAQ